MNYYELRKEVAKLIPRQKVLIGTNQKLQSAIKEKGRKTNYHQFNLSSGEWVKNERLLNTEEFSNFIEVSLRAQACPMCLNIDVWDGILCPFKCRYCFADYFRGKLYPNFFDNGKAVKLRSCNPEFFKPELSKYFDNIGKPTSSEIQRAINNKMPIRIGIRFEDFHLVEKKRGVSLELLKFLASSNYPVMINTKSDLVADEAYLKALTDNPAKAAVHVTLISSDENLLKKLEPGAPSYSRRLEAMRKMSAAGIRVVARIEPYMAFINDHPDAVKKYIDEVYEAGVRHMTFDTYSFSVNNAGIKENYIRQGYDYNRMFLLTSESQAIGSLLLNKFMEMFKEKGFKCSTFDLGNVPYNDDDICCQVGDWFSDSKFNYGSTVGAIRYIQRQQGKLVNWKEFENFVNNNGGFLSDKLKEEVHQLWQMENGGLEAYSMGYGQGILPSGTQGNVEWQYLKNDDFRMNILEGCL